MTKVVETKHAPGAIGPYSQGFIVNGLIYTSDQIPVNPEDGTVGKTIKDQAELEHYLHYMNWRRYK